MNHELFAFYERSYPSANVVLLRGPRPVLVDTGFGSDSEALIIWLAEQNVRVEQLAMVVNTHYHSDHVGGNHALQRDYGIAVAAHSHEAEMVNARDANACASVWLRQPVDAYVVNHVLNDGDVIDTGLATWNVMHTPGHTAGHVCLFENHSRVLVAGDAFHGNDVGWLNPYLEGRDVLSQSIETVHRLAALRPRIALSGHGALIDDPVSALTTALQRLERWSGQSEAVAWHAVKRIFAFALMIEGGLSADDVPVYLSQCTWASDIAANPFNSSLAEFSPTIVAEMLRSGAAKWEGDRLVAGAAHTPTRGSWPGIPVNPSVWPVLSR